MNPLFIEYYPHEACNCYKVRNPWTKYAEEVIVLCQEKEGLEFAKTMAVGVLNKKLQEALSEPERRN